MTRPILSRTAARAPWCTALALLACSPRAAVQAAAPIGDVSITLERGPCFGTCPVYRLTVDGAGQVRYEGRAHVSVVGRDSAVISQSEVRRLLAEFDRAGFAQLADQYTAGQPSCPLYAPDSPTAITSLTQSGATKRVEHDYGCADVPRALTALERLIDDVIGSDRWTGRSRSGS
ncbi:MAG TPA: DUF6438 domain-containing protein [Gemmatimonadales bacterium]|nr:DUF6438 domain-containing protein [Gemmatimonadales bacterium]